MEIWNAIWGPPVFKREAFFYLVFKREAFFYLKFLNGLHIQINEALSLARCMRSGTINAVRRAGTQFLTVPILTTMAIDKVRCTSLLHVPKFLASEATH
jgi:hypothetical protein